MFLVFSFIFKSFSLIANITFNNWENLTGIPLDNIVGLNNNYNVTSNFLPLFIFCFTAWCPHCQRVLPGWEQYQNEVSENNLFIAASLNCSTYADICRNLKIRALPTFLTYFHGDIRDADCSYDLKTYRKIGEKITLIQQGKILKQYNPIEDQPTFSQYPSFVFSFNYKLQPKQIDSKSELENSNDIEVNNLEGFDSTLNKKVDSAIDTEAMEIANKAMISFNSNQDSYFYLNSTRNFDSNDEAIKNRRITVFLDDDVSIDMKSEFTIQNILDFAKENSIKLFGDFSFSSLRKMKRKFAIYAPKIKKEKKDKKKKAPSSSVKYSKIIDSDIKKFAVSNLDKFAWGSAKEFGEETFNKIFRLKTSDYPAIVVVDINLTRFAKITKIKSRSEIDEFFRLVEFFGNNNVNEADGVKNIFQSLEIDSDIDQLFDMLNTFLTVFVATLVILLICVLIGFLVYCFYVKKPGPKHD